MRSRLYRLRKVALCLFLILSMLFCLSSCLFAAERRAEEEFYGDQKWPSREEMLTVYLALYRMKLAELAEKYGIVYEEKLFVRRWGFFDYYMYNEEFVFSFVEGWDGYDEIKIVYFGDAEEDLRDTEAQTPYICLADDFIQYSMYKVSEEHSLLRLYEECLQNGTEREREYLYEELRTSRYGYGVNLNVPYRFDEPWHGFDVSLSQNKFDPSNPNDRTVNVFYLRGILTVLY